MKNESYIKKYVMYVLYNLIVMYVLYILMLCMWIRKLVLKEFCMVFVL